MHWMVFRCAKFLDIFIILIYVFNLSFLTDDVNEMLRFNDTPLTLMCNLGMPMKDK